MTTATHSKDGLRVQLAELRAQRSGISPKLGIYQTLSAEIKALEDELGGSGGFIENLPMPTSLNGARMRQGGLTRQHHIKVKATCSHTQPACIQKGCPKPVKLKGLCKKCNGQKYRTYCTDHGARS